MTQKNNTIKTHLTPKIPLGRFGGNVVKNITKHHKKITSKEVTSAVK